MHTVAEVIPGGKDILDAGPVRLLHRGAGSDIPLLARFGEGLVPVWSATPNRLDGVLDRFRDRLATDGYFGINGMYRPLMHGEDGLRYLNAAYADLDHPGLPFEQARVLVYQAVAHEILPEPSILVRSGAGSWALWLLRDSTNPEQPPRAWPEKIDLYRRIERKIVATIEDHVGDLCPDPRATDAARVMRLPNSIHSGTGNQVVFNVGLRGDGTAYSYTLDELADFFGVEQKPARVMRVQAKSNRWARRGERAQRGIAYTNRLRWEEFQRLEKHRGGFQDGCRECPVWVGAVLCLKAGHTVEETLNIMGEIGSRCHPTPVSSRRAEEQVRGAVRCVANKQRGGGNIQSVRLAEYLGVSVGEADRLGLKQIRLDFVPGKRVWKKRAMVE